MSVSSQRTNDPVVALEWAFDLLGPGSAAAFLLAPGRFEHADRTYPIYFDYPYAVSDDVTIQIPPGWQIPSLPTGWADTTDAVGYSFKAEGSKGALHLSRNLEVKFIFLDTKYYAALRNFYQKIKTTDDQQVVLEAGAPKASN